MRINQSRLIIGLTGGIGSGKSSATEMFKRLGIPVIDADVIAHQLTLPDSEALLEISKQLGQQFVTPLGELDRKKLAQFIFDHPDKKTLLENILHPRIRATINSELQKTVPSPYVVLAIPLLLETNFTDLVDRVLVIDAPDEIRMHRVMERDARSAENVKAIMGHQIERETRLKRADDIVDNSGTLEELQALVNQLHDQYLKISS